MWLQCAHLMQPRAKDQKSKEEREGRGEISKLDITQDVFWFHPPLCFGMIFMLQVDLSHQLQHTPIVQWELHLTCLLINMIPPLLHCISYGLCTY